MTNAERGNGRREHVRGPPEIETRAAFLRPLVRGEIATPFPLLCPPTAPYRHTLGGTLIRPGAGQALARGHEVDVFGRPNER